MSQYEKLDSLIVARLKSRSATFSELQCGSIKFECERIVESIGGDAFRVLDRRLQHLRKKCQIYFDRRIGWVKK